MLKHTAGPWEVRPLEMFEGGDDGIQIVAADGTVIADNQTYYPHALALENAPLIAAAPDLLAALVNMVESYEHEGLPEVRPLIAARAAILKATGGAS